MAMIIEQIPEMSDEQLTNLRDNATRMAASGRKTQRAQAEAVLEAVTEAIDTRAVEKKQLLAERRKTRTKKAKAPAAPEA